MVQHADQAVLDGGHAPAAVQVIDGVQFGVGMGMLDGSRHDGIRPRQNWHRWQQPLRRAARSSPGQGQIARSRWL